MLKTKERAALPPPPEGRGIRAVRLMTTIAFDGKILASDSRMINGNSTCQNPVYKMKRVNGIVYSISGYNAWLDAWIKWHQDGCDPANPPRTTLPSGETGTFQAFVGELCFSCTHALPYMQQIDAPDAWGSGYQYAIGAMLHGATAIEAVEAAIKADAYSGGPVRYFVLGADDGDEWPRTL